MISQSNSYDDSSDYLKHVKHFSDIPEILLLLLEKGGEGVATPRGEGGRDSDTSKACRMIFNHVLATMFQQVHGSSRHRLVVIFSLLVTVKP